MTHLFTVNSDKEGLNGADVFFDQEKYYFRKGTKTTIVLQRLEDEWRLVGGDAHLKDAAASMLDKYLMSQH